MRSFKTLSLLSLVATPAASGQTLAFPGAEGFGRFASGGRGGEVYIVTNLNHSGAGSLRDAVANRTVGVPRTVVFAVSGTIYLNSTLRITEGDLTIAGQTAPGDGICLANYPIDPSNSSNVVIRFLRSRLGDVSGTENDAFSCRYATNVIVDHCSFSWSVDETASSYDNTNFTMQWCIISESLRDSVHSKGAHGYGAIWGGVGATFHHNLIAHHDSRNPRFNGARTHGTANELVDMRNNVIYNWRGNSTYGGEPTDTGLQARHNMINNTYKNGPATSTGTSRYRILEPTRNSASTGPTLSLFHISGNHTTASATVTADNWNGGVQVIGSAEFPVMRVDTPFVVPPVVTQSAQGSFPLVLAHAGCRLPTRDTVDARVVSEVQNGTFTYRGSKGNSAGIIDSQADVGGWPTLASTPAPPDADSDGMPDAWETDRGLNPGDPADRNLTNAAGYTNLEVYLNELAAPAFPTPQLETQPVSQTVAIGAGFSLSVTATGVGTISYQWYRGADPVDGATASSVSVTASTPADAGQYTVAVTNDYGSVRSEAATIVLNFASARHHHRADLGDCHRRAVGFVFRCRERFGADQLPVVPRHPADLGSHRNHARPRPGDERVSRPLSCHRDQRLWLRHLGERDSHREHAHAVESVLHRIRRGHHPCRFPGGRADCFQLVCHVVQERHGDQCWRRPGHIGGCRSATRPHHGDDRLGYRRDRRPFFQYIRCCSGNGRQPATPGDTLHHQCPRPRRGILSVRRIASAHRSDQFPTRRRFQLPRHWRHPRLARVPRLARWQRFHSHLHP